LAIFSRVRQAWNAFRNQEDAITVVGSDSFSNSRSPSRARRHYSNERTIISSIYTRISVDMSGVEYHHVKVDSQNRYESDQESDFQNCLTIQPNIDQAPRAFRQDIALTLFDKGVAALVPVDTTVDPMTGVILDIQSIRVGEIIAWYPRHVRVSVYNEAIGQRQEILLEKRFVAIIENPLYSVMNEPNSTLQRLIRKLNLLDVVDEQSASGKLDIIIQLPYVIKSEARRAQAEQRRKDIEFQLKGSQYGIAYSDATEKITQLNRPAENNLMTQVTYLINLLYTQLGLTEDVMNGTADEKTMLNYENRTVVPLVDAVLEAMQRTFIGRRRMTEDFERILYFSNPFKYVPIGQLADIVDKFTRNEILSSNEIRGFMKIAPSADPKADKLQNSNMPQTDAQGVPVDQSVQQTSGDLAQSALDEVDVAIEKIFKDLGA